MGGTQGQCSGRKEGLRDVSKLCLQNKQMCLLSGEIAGDGGCQLHSPSKEGPGTPRPTLLLNLRPPGQVLEARLFHLPSSAAPLPWLNGAPIPRALFRGLFNSYSGTEGSLLFLAPPSLFVFKFNVIAVLLTYDVVFVSGVQKASQSYIETYPFPFPIWVIADH